MMMAGLNEKHQKYHRLGTRGASDVLERPRCEPYSYGNHPSAGKLPDYRSENSREGIS